MPYIGVLLKGYPSAKSKRLNDPAYDIPAGMVRCIVPDDHIFGIGDLAVFGWLQIPDLPDWAAKQLREPTYTDDLPAATKEEDKADYEDKPCRRLVKTDVLEVEASKVSLSLDITELLKNFSLGYAVDQKKIPVIPWEKAKGMFFDVVEEKAVELVEEAVVATIPTTREDSR